MTMKSAIMSPTDKTNVRHLGLVVVPLAVALEHLGELVLPVVRDDLHVAVPPAPPAAEGIETGAAEGATGRDRLL